MEAEDVLEPTAGQIMSRSLVVIGPEESPMMAWELMRRAGIHHLPVVTDQGLLIGILTREDVAGSWPGGPDANARIPVQRLLGTRRTPRVQEDADLPRVAAIMRDANCNAVPVMAQDGAFVGLITTADVLDAVAGRARPAAAEPPRMVTGMFRLEPVLPG
ncbi:CBS domain-containing protein [Spongiactinospora sp. TRM90649]|uniref:CBS domain-containing protein n=1 Tax=Spongiactinospora sp. TRM90649 TaxID=3031114 RepID=UPI0023F8B3B8|nr:CBS domain-containing protein [Spongiactinospora sp. TRM90649]MDF5755061.1 CBS domain-containing protein [Spongiactinospora sp. TRM90649]